MLVKMGGPNGRPYKPPWPLEPQPFCPLFDFRVIVVWDQAARLLLSAWSQNCCALTPPGRKFDKHPRKTEAATPSPSHFSPNPVVLRLIVMFSGISTGQIVRFRPPGRKMKAIPPPPPNEYCQFSLLDAEPLRLPPAV